MIKRILLAILLCLFASITQAQTSDAVARKAESDRLVALYNSLSGTYQIQIVNSRDKVEIPLAYMDSIVALRKEHEVTYFYYPDKPNVRIMILPYDQIRAAGFQPLQQIAYVTH